MPRPTAKQRLTASMIANAAEIQANLYLVTDQLCAAIEEVPALEAVYRGLKGKLELHTADLLLAASDLGRLDGKNAETREAQFAVFCGEFPSITEMRAAVETSRYELETSKASVEAETIAFTAARYGARLQAATMEMVAATSEK